MSKLTSKEKQWVKKVQAALNECPSDRIAFYTIGDRNIKAYNQDKYADILDHQDTTNCDFGEAVKLCNANFNEELFFTNPVESTSG